VNFAESRTYYYNGASAPSSPAGCAILIYNN